MAKRANTPGASTTLRGLTALSTNVGTLTTALATLTAAATVAQTALNGIGLAAVAARGNVVAFRTELNVLRRGMRSAVFGTFATKLYAIADAGETARASFSRITRGRFWRDTTGGVVTSSLQQITAELNNIRNAARRASGANPPLGGNPRGGGGGGRGGRQSWLADLARRGGMPRIAGGITMLLGPLGAAWKVLSNIGMIILRISASVYFLSYIVRVIHSKIVSLISPVYGFLKSVTEATDKIIVNATVMEQRFGKAASTLAKMAYNVSDRLGVNISEVLDDLTVLTNTLRAQEKLAGLAGPMDPKALEDIIRMMAVIKATQPDIAARFGMMMPGMISGETRSFSMGFEMDIASAEALARAQRRRMLFDTKEKLRQLDTDMRQRNVSGVAVPAEMISELDKLEKRYDRLQKKRIYTAEDFKKGLTLEFIQQTTDTYIDEDSMEAMAMRATASIERIKAAYFLLLTQMGDAGIYAPIQERLKKIADMFRDIANGRLGEVLGNAIGNIVSRFSSFVGQLGESVKSVYDPSKNFMENVRNIAKAIWQDLSEGARSFGNSLKAMLAQEGFQKYVNQFNEIVGALKTAWRIMQGIATAIGLVMGPIKILAGLLSGFVDTLVYAVTTLVRAVQNVSAAFEEQSAYSDYADAIQNKKKDAQAAQQYNWDPRTYALNQLNHDAEIEKRRLALQEAKAARDAINVAQAEAGKKLLDRYDTATMMMGNGAAGTVSSAADLLLNQGYYWDATDEKSETAASIKAWATHETPTVEMGSKYVSPSGRIVNEILDPSPPEPEKPSDILQLFDEALRRAGSEAWGDWEDQRSLPGAREHINLYDKPVATVAQGELDERTGLVKLVVTIKGENDLGRPKKFGEFNINVLPGHTESLQLVHNLVNFVNSQESYPNLGAD